jgi:hypothetical protein
MSNHKPGILNNYIRINDIKVMTEDTHVVINIAYLLVQYSYLLNIQITIIFNNVDIVE